LRDELVETVLHGHGAVRSIRAVRVHGAEGPTLDGHANVKIPPETQTGQVFRLRNKGIKGVRSSVHGDLYCHVVIETPVKLTQRQKEILREFEAINAENPGAHNPRAKNWYDRVREFFGP